VAPRRAFLAVGVLGVALYAIPTPIDATAPLRIDRPAPAARAPAARRVVLVSIDGLAPWVLKAAAAPTLGRLAAEGASAAVAETVVPSVTLASHTSMVSGRPPGPLPDGHGVDWNRWLPWRHLRVSTVFSACREARLVCGLVAGKVKFAHYAVDEPGVAHYAYGADAAEVLDLAAEWLRAGDPDLLMVHLAEVDTTGHGEGWGSAAQRAAIERIDTLLGGFLERARAVSELQARGLALIVTADHGGHATRHGGAEESDVRIPWIAWGDGVPRGLVLPHVSTRDTAATALDLLGVPAAAAAAGIPGRSRLAPAAAAVPAPAAEAAP
jgi:hypothetical protein